MDEIITVIHYAKSVEWRILGVFLPTSPPLQVKLIQLELKRLDDDMQLIATYFWRVQVHMNMSKVCHPVIIEDKTQEGF